MSFTVDEEKLNGTDARQTGKIVSMDPAHPPVKSIPFMEYPRVVYKHPKEPFQGCRAPQHAARNCSRRAHFLLSTSQKWRWSTKRNSERVALKDGWVKEPYVAEAGRRSKRSDYTT